MKEIIQLLLECQSKRSIEFKALKKIPSIDECNAVQQKYDLQKLRNRNDVSQTNTTAPAERSAASPITSVAWRLPPGEEVGRVALFQLHQKCVLGEFQLHCAVHGAFLLPFQ